MRELAALFLAVVTWPLGIAAAQAEALFADSLNLQVVVGTTETVCPDRSGRPVNTEQQCVTISATGDDRFRVIDGYFTQLSESRWLLRVRRQSNFLFARWSSANCIEQFGFDTLDPQTIMLSRDRQPACGNERYFGSISDDFPPPLAPKQLSETVLFPGALGLRLINGAESIDCPGAIEQSAEADSVCVRPRSGHRDHFIGYLYQLSEDGWILNVPDPPAYIFSRWVSPNCTELFVVSALETAPAGGLMLSYFREPICGSQRFWDDLR